MEYTIVIINQPVYSDDNLIVVSNYEMELTYEIVNTSLSDFNKDVRDELWSILNELSKLESKKMSKEDREAYICSKISLEKEHDIRGVFIHELETLL